MRIRTARLPITANPVLVFGDLSYNGRYAKSNVLLCRKVDLSLAEQSSESMKNYCYVTRRDHSLYEPL
jgi:hypothetical protein